MSQHHPESSASPNPSTKDSSTSAAPPAPERKIKYGDWVIFQDHSTPLKAVCSYVDREGRPSLAVLQRAQWIFKDSVALDPNPSAPTAGLWRWDSDEKK